MDPRINPYSPGAGVRPVELAGRDAEVEAFEIMVARALAGRPAQSIMFYGLRGVGKTVLLSELLGSARAAGWIAAKVEADTGSERTPFRTQVASALSTSLRQAYGRPHLGDRFRAALRTFTAFSLTASPDGALSIGLDVDPQRGRGDTGSILADLTDLAIDLGEAAIDLGAGAVLFVDELQHLDSEELGAICQACHETAQRNLPFFVVGAGLPNLPGLLSIAKSYSERLFHYIRLDRLDDGDARVALERPAELEGVEWSDDAMATVLRAAGGYPFFIQQYGQTTWDAAITSPISGADATEGIRVGREKLDRGFFRARWERATPAERAYLAAMAIDGDGPSLTGTIAARLGKKPTSLGPTRANLINKGLVYPPEHGQIAFTVPGMAGFIRREDRAD
ncbi:MAG: ATP-binding protein [Acidimicrobiales bacterium]|nr:ATP-binding protein [Acidimicrobiales bacterium]